MPHIYNAPNLPSAKHAFFGRTGGFSKGIYNSLNFNCRGDDKIENLQGNYNIVGAYYGLGGDRVMRLRQVHGAEVVYVDKPSQYQLEADGVVTDKYGIVLGIATADCIPVLMADFKNGVIGAAHAGWRSALKGVIENTLQVMIEHGAKLENIALATGPCLQQKDFEVKDDMRDMFIEQSAQNSVFFTPIEDGKYLCDLEQYVKHRAELFGVKNITVSGINTYDDDKHYFSYRRFCHRNLIKQQGAFGVELSTICL